MLQFGMIYLQIMLTSHANACVCVCYCKQLFFFFFLHFTLGHFCPSVKLPSLAAPPCAVHFNRTCSSLWVCVPSHLTFYDSSILSTDKGQECKSRDGKESADCDFSFLLVSFIPDNCLGVNSFGVMACRCMQITFR